MLTGVRTEIRNNQFGLLGLLNHSKVLIYIINGIYNNGHEFEHPLGHSEGQGV